VIRPRRDLSAGEVGGHYDELDRFYRIVWGRGIHHGLWTEAEESPEEAVRNLVDEVARAAALEPGSRVCDVGSGYGEPARMLTEGFGARITGFTLSRRQAEEARRAPVSRGSPPEFRVGDFLENDLADGSFDAVIALESTAHMSDKAGFFVEARRLLARGGRLVVAAWTASGEASSRQERYLLEPICRYGRLPSLGTPGEYETWTRHAGLELLGARDLTREVRRTWSIVLRRIPLRLLPRPSTWRYLLSPRSRHRDFLLAVPLIWLAQHLGSLRYTLLTARRDPGG
jgi:tocopherol O-methyltransferase